MWVQTPLFSCACESRTPSKGIKTKGKILHDVNDAKFLNLDAQCNRPAKLLAIYIYKPYMRRSDDRAINNLHTISVHSEFPIADISHLQIFNAGDVYKRA